MNQETGSYVGIFGLYDPPREDSAETIKIAESMGINVKMVTGIILQLQKKYLNKLI